MRTITVLKAKQQSQNRIVSFALKRDKKYSTATVEAPQTPRLTSVDMASLLQILEISMGDLLLGFAAAAILF